MLNIGGPELLIILLVALVVLGPQRLPDVARQMGQMVSSLRSLAAGFQAELEAASKPDPAASMTLDGPTNQADAIASTQGGNLPATAAQEVGWTVRQPFAAASPDAEELAAAARKVTHDGDVKPVSPGGPADLRNTDASERNASELDDAVGLDASELDDAVALDGVVADEPASSQDSFDAGIENADAGVENDPAQDDA